MLLLTIAVSLTIASVTNGDVTITSRLTPFQMTFGNDGRLRMDSFEKKTACGYEEPATTGGLQDEYIPDGTTTVGEQYYPVSTHDSLTAPTTAFYGTTQLPCATYQTTSIDTYNIPEDGSTILLPVRLDFTLNNPDSNDIQVRFMNGNNEIYVVEFKRGGGIEIEHESATLNLQFDESHRFWVTYENGEVKVGLHGNDSPLVHYTDPIFTTNEVDCIELYSKTRTPTEWKFYEPCTFEA